VQPLVAQFLRIVSVKNAGHSGGIRNQDCVILQ